MNSRLFAFQLSSKSIIHKILEVHHAHDALQAQSKPLPPTPNLADFTALISTLQEVAQALLYYSQNNQTSPKHEKHEQYAQHFDVQTTAFPSLPLSKRAKRKECFKDFCYNPHDSTAFADKEIAQYFEKDYISGNFNDEIRYYHVPANIVRHEYRLLCRHQQKDIVGLLSSIQNELDLKSKLISYMSKDISELPLMQLSVSISQSLKLLQTIYAHLDNFKLVHKTMLPRQK